MAEMGFTLVEIMIVVAIIGLLAGIAIPSLKKARMTSQTNKALGDLRVIRDAIEQLAFDTGQWPGGVPASQVSSPETMDLNDGAAGISANDGRFNNWSEPYMKEVPPDPWGTPYFFDPDYRIGGTFFSVVGSLGPNKQGRNYYDDDDIYIVLE